MRPNTFPSPPIVAAFPFCTEQRVGKAFHTEIHLNASCCIPQWDAILPPQGGLQPKLSPHPFIPSWHETVPAPVFSNAALRTDRKQDRMDPEECTPKPEGLGLPELALHGYSRNVFLVTKDECGFCFWKKGICFLKTRGYF